MTKKYIIKNYTDLANPILGTGSWNTPLPVQHAKFITDKTK